MNSLLRFRPSLLRCARMMSDEINTILLPYQLNYSLWQILFVIQEKHGCTSIEMADYLNVSKPSIAKRIHVLMQMGVLSQIETEDKRQKKLMLSDQGIALFQQCAAEIDNFERQLIQNLDQQDIQRSIKILHAIINDLEINKTGEQHE
ncbi:MarR family winged helix-turn-helix transcriptional regulator [Acinetobacter sp. ANC 3903]|uniref:MarR family winged helix-turn-helix transcriptional regulator n=1 Tax=Acinetobacter sp. ANC 3903 TaxID=1977883 RepID=UPI001D17AD1F|nr:winged helix DNA-binding protein [Acinetobacter sp. ANC 3903]